MASALTATTVVVSSGMLYTDVKITSDPLEVSFSVTHDMAYSLGRGSPGRTEITLSDSIESGIEITASLEGPRTILRTSAGDGCSLEQTFRSSVFTDLVAGFKKLWDDVQSEKVRVAVLGPRNGYVSVRFSLDASSTSVDIPELHALQLAKVLLVSDDGVPLTKTFGLLPAGGELRIDAEWAGDHMRLISYAKNGLSTTSTYPAYAYRQLVHGFRNWVA